MVDITNLVEKLNVRFEGQIGLIENVQAILANKANVVEVLKTVKQEFNFWLLADITAADYEDRYEVIYHLMNDGAELLEVKVKLDKADIVMPSVTSVWKAANEQEREVFDLMGITFDGHPNLTRILCPEDFEGHPLRKSFKLDTVSRF